MYNKQEQLRYPWHAHSAKDVFLALKSSRDGLPGREVKDRLEYYGKNQLPKQDARSGFSIFIAQFVNPLMIILMIAAGISGILGEFLDTSVILVAVLLNAFLGFAEEFKADRSIERLKSFLPQKVHIRRQGVTQIVPAEEIVPGDIVLLTAGDRVAADGRVITAQACQVSEAALTGESSSIDKNAGLLQVGVGVSDRKNMLYAGTVVVAGHAEIVVTATGAETEIGKITELVTGVEQAKTPLQEQMSYFAKWIGIAVLVITGIVFIIGVIQGVEFLEMIRISVALAVSAIPEGLVVALTVILAIGMQRILKKKALVRRLVAAETLGSVSVICMDKTGTLTTGEMTVAELKDQDGKTAENIDSFPELGHALWNTRDVFIDEANDTFSGSPTEVAIMNLLWKRKDFYTERACTSLSEIPFNSSYKYKAKLCALGNEKIIYVVGAPDILLKQLDLSDVQLQKYYEVLNEMVEKGYRVLLVARKDGQAVKKIEHKDLHDLELLGFIGLIDPLRETAKKTIDQARTAGLLPIMITGDHKKTAFFIARDAGLVESENEILTGEELDVMNSALFEEKVKEIRVYARVLPKHKLRIVSAWRAHGHAVAMVGDGVNDAPAVKGADIGIALGSGTEVAKETADMVLLDNHFATIIGAIEQGRTIFDNIRKMVVYLLADSFTAIVLILGAVIFGLPLPILPAQILWINLVSDGFPSIALTFEKGEKGIMKEPPRKKDEPILNTEMKVLIFIIGLVTDLALFGIYFYLLGQELDIDHIRTFIFIALGIDSLFYIFAVRKFRVSIFRTNPFENKWLVVGIVIGFLFLMTPMLVPILREWFRLTPLTVVEWLILILLAFVKLLLIELVKLLFNKHIMLEKAA